MVELNILKGNKSNLPEILNENNIYVATSDTEYSEIIACGKPFPSKKYLDDDFVLGYYMHLYVDFLWFKYFLTEIRDESEVTKLDGTKVNLKGNMFEMYLYSDYTNLNSQLFDLYDIDCKIFYMDLPEIPDIIKEIPMDRLNAIIEETGKIIEKTNERKEYIINIEHVKKFIETAVKFIISDLTILGIIKK